MPSSGVSVAPRPTHYTRTPTHRSNCTAEEGVHEAEPPSDEKPTRCRCARKPQYQPQTNPLCCSLPPDDPSSDGPRRLARLLHEIRLHRVVEVQRAAWAHLQRVGEKAERSVRTSVHWRASPTAAAGDGREFSTRLRVEVRRPAGDWTSNSGSAVSTHIAPPAQTTLRKMRNHITGT